MKFISVLFFALFTMSAFSQVLPNSCYLAPTDDGFGVRCGDRTQVTFDRSSDSIIRDVQALLDSGYRFMRSDCTITPKGSTKLLLRWREYKILSCSVNQPTDCSDVVRYFEDKKICSFNQN